MKPKFWLASVCLSLCMASCQRSPETEPTGDQTPAANICQPPAAIDMAGAVPFGDGTPGSITQDALQKLINAGGKIIFNGGAAPRHAHTLGHAARGCPQGSSH